MQEIKQDQIDVRILEKETVMLAIRILEKDCGRFFNVIPLLKFFGGLYLTMENIQSCKETLESIDEAISNYKNYLLSQDNTIMYCLENDYVKLFNKVTVKSIFNKNLLNINIFASDYLIYRHVVLSRLLDKINYIIQRRTFITVDSISTTNNKYFVSSDDHFPLKSACVFNLTYPNKIGILNSFPTMEKLSVHFMSKLL